MVKVEVIQRFTYEKFGKLNNIKRINANENEDGWLYVGDTFECDENTANYLSGNNSKNATVVKVVEYIPPVVETYKAKVVDADKVEVKVIVDEKKVKEEAINAKKPKKRNNKNIKK